MNDAKSLKILSVSDNWLGIFFIVAVIRQYDDDMYIV